MSEPSDKIARVVRAYQTMTGDEFEQKMKECFASGDEEADHYEADKLMCRLLEFLGYGKGIDVFRNSVKWYA